MADITFTFNGGSYSTPTGTVDINSYPGNTSSNSGVSNYSSLITGVSFGLTQASKVFPGLAGPAIEVGVLAERNAIAQFQSDQANGVLNPAIALRDSINVVNSYLNIAYLTAVGTGDAPVAAAIAPVSAGLSAVSFLSALAGQDPKAIALLDTVENRVSAAIPQLVSAAPEEVQPEVSALGQTVTDGFSALNDIVSTLQVASTDATKLIEGNTVTDPNLSAIAQYENIPDSTVTENLTANSNTVTISGSPTPASGTVTTSIDLSGDVSSNSIFNLPNGSSVTSVSSTGEQVRTTYSGANGSGSVTSIDQENTDGTSQITNFDANGKSTTTTYSGLGGTGSVLSSISHEDDGSASVTVSDSNSQVTVHFDASNIILPTIRVGTATQSSSVGAELTSASRQTQNVANILVQPLDIYGGNFIASINPFFGYLSLANPDATITFGSQGYSGSYSQVIVPVQVFDDLSLTAQPAEFDFTVNQNIYQTASASYTLATNTDSTQIFHVGDAASTVLQVQNTATGALNDALEVSNSGATGPFSLAAPVSNLQGGQTTSVTVNIDTSQSGSFYSAASLFDNVSHDSELADTQAFTTQNVSLVAQIDDYASPTVQLNSNYYDEYQGATLSSSGNNYTINFGSLPKGMYGFPSVELDIGNASDSGLRDDLSGSFDVGGGTYNIQDATDFSDVSAGSTGAELFITADTAAAGTNTQTIILHPTGTNGSGYSGALPDVTINLVDDVACYCAGTRIMTVSGERPVEQLGIGDRLVTHLGAIKIVKWIGTRSYDARFARSNEDIRPIRISAGALAAGVPHSDLLVSPLHAMFLNGVLVPAKLLVNEKTILREQSAGSIHYFHIELDTHDIIVANGAAAESFVDCDSRGMFQNEADYHIRYPHDHGPRWAFCAPRIEDGHKLEEIRNGLALHAGIAVDTPCVQSGPLHGYLDTASLESISGWAWQSDHPDIPVRLEVVIDGGVVAQLIANRDRADVRAAGFGNGRCGFEFTLPARLSPFAPHEIRVRRLADGTELEFSPRTFEATPILDATSRAALSAAIQAQAAGTANPDDLEELLRVLVTGTDRLLRARMQQQPLPARRTATGKLKGRTKGQLQAVGGSAPFALFIDDCVPKPDQDAGSAAVISHMRSLMRLGYRVGFTARDMAAKGSHTKALEAMGIVCLGTPYYASVEEVLRRHSTVISVVYLHRIGNASLYGEIVRQACPKARIVYSVADLHFVRLGRQAALESRPALGAIGRQLQAKEMAAARQADAVITHSTYEAAVLRQVLPGLNVHVVPWVFEAMPVDIPFVNRTGLAFVGGYGHQPNVDAAMYLVRDIMPRIWQHAPSIECLLVGSNMPESVSRLAGERIQALGHVPNLASVLGRVRLTVAPMRYGAGLKGKVLHSLAAGLPCVCTSVAVEGMGLPSALTSLIGRSGDELAAIVVQLHSDQAENSRCSLAGLDFMQTAFSAAHVDSLMQAVLTGSPNRTELISAVS